MRYYIKLNTNPDSATNPQNRATFQKILGGTNPTPKPTSGPNNSGDAPICDFDLESRTLDCSRRNFGDDDLEKMLNRLVMTHAVRKSNFRIKTVKNSDLIKYFSIQLESPLKFIARSKKKPFGGSTLITTRQ